MVFLCYRNVSKYSYLDILLISRYVTHFPFRIYALIFYMRVYMAVWRGRGLIHSICMVEYRGLKRRVSSIG
jgi:hypothetical protein